MVVGVCSIQCVVVWCASMFHVTEVVSCTLSYVAGSMSLYTYNMLRSITSQSFMICFNY